MRFALSLLFCLFGATTMVHAAQEPAPKREKAPSIWEKSVVHIDVTRKQYDYTQPWSKRMKKGQKEGIVISANEILTTADEMFDRTLVRIQKGGRGKWWQGSVSWIDYHANLAIVTSSEAGFWDGLKPAEFASSAAGYDSFQIVRWREGKLETRRAEFTQFSVDTTHLSFVSAIEMEMSSEIQGAGWSEPVIADSKVIGLLSEQTGNKCSAIPSSFIVPILEAHKAGSYRGLGFFDFYWQPASNPALLSYLKLDGEPRGVVVNEVSSKPGTKPVLQERDIILQAEGFDIDIQGDYNDPDYGPLSLENLSTRGKWSGDEVKMKIWREGHEMEITYRLPKAEYSTTLIPDAVYDQEPEYLIVGGMVFQPLNDPYLQSWGPDWKRRSPFRLYYYNNQDASLNRPSLIFLNQVLPDRYNIGFQELRHLVVDEVNGQKVNTLQQLNEALKKPIDGFHRIQFMLGDSTRHIVIAADGQEPATQRVLRRYGIPKSFVFATPSPAKTPATAAANE